MKSASVFSNLLARSYFSSVAYILVFIVLAHLLAPDEYVLYRNSISQLAGQGYDLAWVMRAGFIAFGILVLIAGVGRIGIDRGRVYREFPIMLYGLAILMSGIFSTNPFIEGVPYSEAEAQLHTVFATAAGVALSVGILLVALTEATKTRSVIHWIALVLTALLSMMLGNLPMVMGAFQRALWAVGFS